MRRFICLSLGLPAIILLILTLTGCDNGSKNKIARLQAENAELKRRIEADSATAELEAKNAELENKVQRLNKVNQELEQKLSVASKPEHQAEERATSITATGELQVRMLKLYQSSSSHTSIDAQITNRSNQFVDYWKIGIDVYDRNGQYLGHTYTNGRNLRPGQTITSEFIFSDMRASSVGKWDLQMDQILIGGPGGKSEDATKDFRVAVANR